MLPSEPQHMTGVETQPLDLKKSCALPLNDRVKLTLFLSECISVGYRSRKSLSIIGAH